VLGFYQPVPINSSLFELGFISKDSPEGCDRDGSFQVIDMICDPDAGPGTPTKKDSTDANPCNLQFEWRSLYACKQCNLTRDFAQKIGECRGGTKTILYQKLSFCVGIAPPAETISCSALEVKWGIIFGVMGTVTGILLLLAIGVIYFYRKKRVLEIKYQHLEQTQDTEL